MGEKLVEHLRAEDADVMFSEVDESVVERFRAEPDLTFVPAPDVYATPCDVFSPCARGGVLNDDTISRLRCRIIAGGANNQLARAEIIDALRERNILYLPDYVVNVGGAMGITGMEAMGWDPDDAEKRVTDAVRGALHHILDLVAAEGISTEAAARRIAEKHLSSGVG